MGAEIGILNKGKSVPHICRFLSIPCTVEILHHFATMVETITFLGVFTQNRITPLGLISFRRRVQRSSIPSTCPPDKKPQFMGLRVPIFGLLWCQKPTEEFPQKVQWQRLSLAAALSFTLKGLSMQKPESPRKAWSPSVGFCLRLGSLE